MLAGEHTLNSAFFYFQIELDIDPDDKVRAICEDSSWMGFADLH